MDYKFTPEEYKSIGNYLLLELGNAGVLSESQVKKIHAQSRILNEEVEIDDDIASLFEHEEDVYMMMESQETKTSFEGGFIIFTIYGTTHTIDPATFASAYMDPKNTQPRDVLRAIGISISDLDRFEKERDRGQFNNRLIRMVDIYNENVAATSKEASALPTWSQRKNVIRGMKQAAATQDTTVSNLPEELPEHQPTDKQIDGGKRGRRDNIIARINNAEITPGEFYRDLTRISRSRRRNWLRFWQKDLSRMRPQRRTLLGRLIGKAWRRSFLLGYQVNRTIFYEVWYNSIDSTFSVYDRNGVEVHYAVPTLQEAVRLLIRTIAQEAPGDAEVFSGGSAGRLLSNSLQRSLQQSLGTDVNKLRSEEQARAAEIEREKREWNEKKQEIDNDRSRQKSADNDRAVRDIVSTGAALSAGIRKTASMQYDAMKSGAEYAARDVVDVAKSGGPVADDVRSAVSKAKQSRAGRWLSDDQGSKKTEPHKMDPNLQSDAQKTLDDMQINAAREANEKALEELRMTLEDIYDASKYGDIDILKQSQNPASRAMSSYTAIGRGSPLGATRELEVLRSQVEEAIRDIENRLGSESNLMKYAKDEEQRTMSKTPTKRDVIDPILSKAAERLKRINRGNLNESMTAAQRYRMNQDQEARKRDEELAKENPSEFLASRDADRVANEIRNRAEASPYNKQLLIQDINDSIETYDVTRVRQSLMKSLIPSWLGRFRRGRRSAIQTPHDARTGLFNRAKQFFLGEEFRADFVMGYSMSGIIDIEIWYITEMDPNGTGRMLSTFYVYDVTAQKIIRSHLPYLRNAIPVVAAKMGVNAGGL